MSPTTSILVTACSADGIGAAIALALARRSHHVFATAREPNETPEVLKTLPSVTILHLDVEAAASVAAAARSVTETGHVLDVLVNNASVGYVRSVLKLNIAAAQRLFDVNFWGPLRMTRTFAKFLIASRGRTVNVTSTSSVFYSPWICTFKLWLSTSFLATQPGSVINPSLSKRELRSHITYLRSFHDGHLAGRYDTFSNVRRVQGRAEHALRDPLPGA